MSEPETITLRKLPPEHKLRKWVDLLKQRDIRNSFEIVHGLDGTAVKDTSTDYSACYCRAEDYPPEYDKPSIDPGEGWRLLAKGERLQEGDEVLLGVGWSPTNLWETKITVGHNNYRRRITQQPDRLTELRQQGERQAARIVELESEWNTAETQCVALEKVNNGLRKAISNKNDQILALQEQVRSAEEALRLEKQRCDSTSIELDDVCCERDNLKDRIKELESIAAPDLGCIESQARAWSEVCQTLTSVTPRWHQLSKTGKESACEAIRLLAMQNKSLIEQSNKTHEVNVELQRQVQQLAEQSKPLRWERRKPTEEECRERWILIEDGAYPPACTDIKDWEKMGAREICVLPPIAEPEPEPKMVTQRRWLCHNGSHSWVEVWPDDGKEPTDQWVERVRTDVTREVPE